MNSTARGREQRVPKGREFLLFQFRPLYRDDVACRLSLSLSLSLSLPLSLYCCGLFFVPFKAEARETKASRERRLRASTIKTEFRSERRRMFLRLSLVEKKTMRDEESLSGRPFFFPFDVERRRRLAFLLDLIEFSPAPRSPSLHLEREWQTATTTATALSLLLQQLQQRSRPSPPG